MKGPEIPSDEKELPMGPPDSTEEDPELPDPLASLRLAAAPVGRCTATPREVTAPPVECSVPCRAETSDRYVRPEL